jgi:hypothetical protein
VILVAQVSALIAIMGIGVVYGTDAFCALVQRPALARVDDAALTAVMGNVHRYGDRRMPVPGVIGLLGSAAASVLGLLGSAAASVLAAVAGRTDAAVSAAISFVFLVVWLVLYTRISAPINRVLTSAADRGETPANARALQADWDRIIFLRAVLQGLALLAVATTVILL